MNAKKAWEWAGIGIAGVVGIGTMLIALAGVSDAIIYIIRDLIHQFH